MNKLVSDFGERTMHGQNGKVISYIEQVTHRDPEKMRLLVTKVYAGICAGNDQEAQDSTLSPSRDLEAWAMVKSSLSFFF